jgi:DNA-binding transcriptional LysR family regulator
MCPCCSKTMPVAVCRQSRARLLRHMLKDELFVRSPDGMLPAPRAERMYGPIHQALQEADAFDPSQDTNTFRIAANNHAARAVIPPLVQRLAAQAPSVGGTPHP